MDDDIRAFGIDLGHKAIGRDWAGLHSMLAPWLQANLTPDDVRVFFEDAYREMLKANGIAGMYYPEYADPDVDGNDFTNATELRKPISFLGGKIRPVPAELTDENFRYWLKVQLQCSDAQMAELGFDYLSEVWMAVVEIPEGLRVGYWSQGAY
jgi:hypothetical protein